MFCFVCPGWWRSQGGVGEEEGPARTAPGRLGRQRRVWYVTGEFQDVVSYANCVQMHPLGEGSNFLITHVTYESAHCEARARQSEDGAPAPAGSVPVSLLPVLAAFCTSLCTHRCQRVPRFFHIVRNFSDHLFAYSCVGNRKPNSAHKKITNGEVKPSPSPHTGLV